MKTEIARCWNCNRPYSFIRNASGNTIVICPSCGKKNLIKQKIIQRQLTEEIDKCKTDFLDYSPENGYFERERLPNKQNGLGIVWKTLCISLILFCVVFVYFYITETGSLGMDLQNKNNQLIEEKTYHNETRGHLEKITETLTQTTTILDRTTTTLNITETLLYNALHPYMKDVGFDFLDTREPTEQELFVAEESLHICHNPTHSQVINFIESNDLDEYVYGDWFDCDEFSWHLINDSRTEQIRAGFVVIYPIENEFALTEDNPSHAIVVFNTVDNGIIFVDPQLDAIFTYDEFITMQTNNHYYAEQYYSGYNYTIEMDFHHYTIDWFFWYHPYNLNIYCHCFGLFQMWNLYKNEYPNFKSDYNTYFKYEVV